MYTNDGFIDDSTVVFFMEKAMGDVGLTNVGFPVRSMNWPAGPDLLGIDENGCPLFVWDSLCGHIRYPLNL